MTGLEITFRPLLEHDWKPVAEIYLEGIATGNATFQSTIPSWTEWSSSHLPGCRIIAEANNQIVGWAALSPVSSRCVYGGVAEVSVYVSAQFAGRKIGSRLLEKLIADSEHHNIWTLQAGIFPENVSSIKIHEKAGFRKVGFREKIGNMKGVWRDIVLMERRSENIGLE